MENKTISKIRANNAISKKAKKALAKNGGSIRVRKISNGWIATEEWETKNGKGYTDWHSEETYYEKNPFS